MDWNIDLGVLVQILAVGGLFFWSRSESRSDCRRIEDLIAAINNEMKDFHGRLCAPEEKCKQ